MIWALLLGCTGGPCSPADEPTLELGLGRDRYFPIEEGGEALLVYGSQGGQHIDVAFSATGLDMDAVSTTRIEGTLEGERVAFSEPWTQPGCFEDSAQVSAGLRLFMEVDPPDIDGRLMLVSMTLTDPRGTIVTAEKSFLVVDPFDDAN